MQPAYVVGRRWDVLAWNSAAEAVFGDYGALGGDARNIVHMVFTSPCHRHLPVDWEEVAAPCSPSFEPAARNISAIRISIGLSLS